MLARAGDWGSYESENTLLFVLLFICMSKVCSFQKQYPETGARLSVAGVAQASFSLCLSFLFFLPSQISLLNSIHENFSQ